MGRVPAGERRFCRITLRTWEKLKSWQIESSTGHQPVSQPETRHYKQAVLAASPWLFQTLSVISAAIRLLPQLRDFKFTLLPAIAGIPRRSHSTTSWDSMVWRGTTMITVEPVMGDITSRCSQIRFQPSDQSFKFRVLPSGMSRPRRSMGRLFPYPVGKAHNKCPSSSLCSALHNMSTCKTTNCDTKTSNMSLKQPGNLSAGWAALGGRALAHHMPVALPPFLLPPSPTPCLAKDVGLVNQQVFSSQGSEIVGASGFGSEIYCSLVCNI